MRLWLICFILTIPNFGSAQEYVDVLKIGYSRTTGNSFDNTSENTHVSIFEANLTVPIPINPNTAIVTGFIFATNRVQLYPSQNNLAVPFSSLYSSTLKVGIDTNFNKKWGLTAVALPKVASDYSNISMNDVFIGGYSIFRMKKRENLTYKFGFYATTEAFGFISTPIIGWYSLSKNKKFEMDVLLPISTDINYTQGGLTYGFNYFGIGRSFNLEENDSNTYAQLNSLEFAGYLQFNNLIKNVLIRSKIGYSSDDYRVYESGDKIGFGFIAFNFDDNRVQLNPQINGSLFFRLECIYRFRLSPKD